VIKQQEPTRVEIVDWSIEITLSNGKVLDISNFHNSGIENQINDYLNELENEDDFQQWVKEKEIV
jgi:hypothetical protein